MRKLVVCCDGTWNKPEDDNQDFAGTGDTNVVSLSRAIVQNDTGDDAQHVHYQKGVGTKLVDKLTGGALGVGISEDIRECYQFLCRHYRNDQDLIFLFGFSRGAYAARSLAGLIVQCGLLKVQPGESDSDLKQRVKTAYDAYRDGSDAVEEYRKTAQIFDDVSIHFLGVWDTVGSLGIPNHLLVNSLDRRDLFEFHDTRLSDSVKTARHAVAIDEMRESFVPTLWENANDHPDAKEIWFAGVHSDIGGGYEEDGLANITLNWMMDEAGKAGLTYKAGFPQPAENPSGKLHDSAESKFWQQLGLRPRGVPNLLDEQLVHASVRARQQDTTLNPRYRPQTTLEAGTTSTAKVHSVERWNNTGLFLEKGGRYQFTAEGTWHDASHETDADGFERGGLAHIAARAIESIMGFLNKAKGFHEVRLPLTRREPDYNWFSLVGVIAHENLDPGQHSVARNETFLIGKSAVYTAGNSGYLHCYANDTWETYERNNKGSLDLTVKRVG